MVYFRAQNILCVSFINVQGHSDLWSGNISICMHGNWNCYLFIYYLPVQETHFKSPEELVPSCYFI